MIEFNCPTCAKSFRVPEHLAGRSARCKSCGRILTVPSVDAAAHPDNDATPQASETSPRLRRLRADLEQMRQAFSRSELIRIKSTDGDPVERYEIQYTVTGLESDGTHRPVSRDHHRVEIQLPSDYPRVAPLCRMLSPIFHPNIDPAHVCVTDHWTAGERLPDLVIRIGEMIAYQSYNIKSPLNAEAAKWADLHASEFPTDSRPLSPPGW